MQMYIFFKNSSTIFQKNKKYFILYYNQNITNIIMIKKQNEIKINFRKAISRISIDFSFQLGVKIDNKNY